MTIFYTKLGRFQSQIYDKQSMGELHRINGPAIEYTDGTKEWYQYGKQHRIDGPALERDGGFKLWYQNGKLHRLDGPAIEFVDKSVRYYLNDKPYSKEDYEEIAKFYQEGLDILL